MLGGCCEMAPSAPGIMANAWVQLIMMPKEISTREKLTVSAACDCLRSAAAGLRSATQRDLPSERPSGSRAAHWKSGWNHARGVARFERGSCEWQGGKASALRRTRGVLEYSG